MANSQLAAYSVEAAMPWAAAPRSAGGSQIAEAMPVTASTRNAAGSSRRMRRAQKRASETVPSRASSRTRMPVMRKPDSTKNTSTPTKPPAKPGRPA